MPNIHDILAALHSAGLADVFVDIHDGEVALWTGCRLERDELVKLERNELPWE